MLKLIMRWGQRGRQISKRKESDLSSGVQRLMISRELMENVIRSMTNLLIVLNRDNTIRMVNPATCILLGYTENELIRQPFSMIVDDYTLARVQNWDAADDETTADYRVMLRAKSGRLVPVFFTRAVMRDANGQVVGVVCVAQDITDLEKARTEKEIDAMRYRALFEQSYDAILLADTQGGLGVVNRRCCELFGYTQEEMAQMRYTDLIPSRSAAPDASDQTFINLRSGRLVEIYQQTLRRKDGSTFVAEVSAQLVRLAGENPMIQTIVRDISERYAAENQLRFQSVLLENVSDAIVAIDRDRLITHWNRAAEMMYGWTAEEALGQPYDALIQDETTPFQAVNEQYFERGYWLTEVAQRRRDGTLLYVAVSVGVLSGTEGAMVLVHRDITARKTAEMEAARLLELSKQQFEELHRLYEHVTSLEGFKTLMMRIADHDLRSSLASAAMSLKQIRAEGAEENAAHLEMVQESLKRARHVIDELLSIDNIESLAKFEPLDLNDLARRVLREKAVHMTGKSQTLVVEGLSAQAKFMVEGSIVQLYQVIYNLLDNAVKYTPARKQIKVNMQAAETEVLFTVTDEGPGIPPELHDRLFRQFSRLDLPEHQGISGTGMGLFLVKSIVERHGGRMLFTSAPGQGSTFGFALPLYTA